jgi:pyruvate kinase
MQIQAIRLTTDTPQYTFQTNLAEDAYSEINRRANTVFRNQVSRAATRIGTQIHQNIQAHRDVEDGMEELTPITNAPRPPRVNLSDFDGDAINWAAGTNAILSQKHMEQPETKEKTYTMDEIKAWLKENLEVKTQVFESDGEVSVTTTLVLEGEEISSDTDTAIL